MAAKLSAAELRAGESQAWRDLVLSLLPKVDRFFESLRPTVSQADRLVTAVLDGAPALVEKLQPLFAKRPEPPTPEYVERIVGIAKAGNVVLKVGPIEVDPR